ncbi:MAG TPA: ABC transporter permease [Trebonia sp.]|jgi:ribose/xylose/arabinose/galactoside ABC-type transport system permease subunit
MTSPLKRDVGDVTAVTSREQEVALEAEDQRRAQERERGLARRRRITEQLQGEGLVLVLIVVFVVMWVSSQFFLTEPNLLTAASVVSVLGVMAVAETLLVIAGEIDISIGSVMAATSVLMGLMVGDGMNVWLAAIIGLVFSAAVGAVNGIITVYFKINSLVTTLGTYSIFLGIAYAVSNTATTSIGGSGFEELGSGKIGAIPVPVFFFLGLWLIGLGVARWTALGRHIYATGDNFDAAVRAGIQANMLRMGLFIATALSAGLAGVITTSELGSAAPQIGDPYLLSVITAVILGGASLRGGRGTMLGTLVAVAILGVLQNGFALLQFSTYLEDTVLGSLLILAVLTDRLVRRAES